MILLLTILNLFAATKCIYHYDKLTLEYEQFPIADKIITKCSIRDDSREYSNFSVVDKGGATNCQVTYAMDGKSGSFWTFTPDFVVYVNLLSGNKDIVLMCEKRG